MPINHNEISNFTILNHWIPNEITIFAFFMRIQWKSQSLPQIYYGFSIDSIQWFALCFTHTLIPFRSEAHIHISNVLQNNNLRVGIVCDAKPQRKMNGYEWQPINPIQWFFHRPNPVYLETRTIQVQAGAGKFTIWFKIFQQPLNLLRWNKSRKSNNNHNNTLILETFRYVMVISSEFIASALVSSITMNRC